MITLDEIKQHLNIDITYTTDDQYLISLISVATVEVENYINKDLSDYHTIPIPLIHAIKLRVGEYYDEDRTGYKPSSMKRTKAFERLCSQYLDLNNIR
jgi:hypothetical protein